MRSILSIAWLVRKLALPSHAQQIPGALFSFDLLGLSDDCFTVVNSTIVTCPRWLPRHAGIGYTVTALIHCVIWRLTDCLPSGKQALNCSVTSGLANSVKQDALKTLKLQKLQSKLLAFLPMMLWFLAEALHIQVP